MFKYTKYMFTALLLLGLLAVSYGGCGGSTDDSGGDGTPSPTAPPSTDDDVIMPPPTNPPPTDPPDPDACEGDAFGSTATASAREVGDCLTDFIVQNAQDSSLTCFCNASEAGDFILNIAPVFAGSMKINLEFPDNTDPDIIFPTSFSFDWAVNDCTTLELFTTQLFSSEDLISIGTLDDMTESNPDELAFTANISEPILDTSLGNSGQSVSCDFCSIGNLPDCAPEL